MASTRTVEETFYDYSQRRKGIIRALTVEVRRLQVQTRLPGIVPSECPDDPVPPELPEPALGINFARDGMERRDWFSLIAVHSDAWLMSMAFFNAARLDAEGRRLLFNEINSLPTCLEIVLGKARGNGPIAGAAQISKRAAEPPSALHQEPGKRLAQSEYEDAQMATSELPAPARPAPVKLESFGQTAPPSRKAAGSPPASNEDDGEEEDDDDVEYDPCPNCGREFKDGEFWIFCDFCQRWFDGKCVGMTAERAKVQKKWQCPFCATEER
ncbi:hypothetical protein QBZ16_004367 [Prototheca wickerhamii]|uniref:PHD-type domain-containing protein n=1 Tax=Prototheca wickerhamii TaxID=3111 RepID=A0AAD9MHX8_PROWI|nr:hypothetical protein QBZ16_004367 [Prototheca wickerhamii]